MKRDMAIATLLTVMFVLMIHHSRQAGFARIEQREAEDSVTVLSGQIDALRVVADEARDSADAAFERLRDLAAERRYEEAQAERRRLEARRQADSLSLELRRLMPLEVQPLLDSLDAAHDAEVRALSETLEIALAESRDLWAEHFQLRRLVEVQDSMIHVFELQVEQKDRIIDVQQAQIRRSRLVSWAWKGAAAAGVLLALLR